MRFEWEMFEEFDDGSVRDSCDFKIFDDAGKELDWGWVTDHTRPGQKEDDKKVRRDIHFAFDIHGLDITPSCLREALKEYNIAEDDFGYAGFNSLGICKNETYRTNPHEYNGTPSLTIEQVLYIVEKAYVNSISFDYDAELARMTKILDERRALMNEGLAYLADGHKLEVPKR